MSPTYGAKLGWLGTAFLIGVGLHSLFPYQAVDPFVLSVGIALAVIVSLTSIHHFPTRWIGLIILCVCLGVWRFEATRSTLPYGLRPLVPQGLAHVAPSGAPASQQGIEHDLWRIRTQLHDRVNEIFPRDEAALLRGILYGDRDLGKDWQARFRRAGLLHIIAVSGSNIMLVVVIVMAALLGLGCSRRWAFVTLSAVLVLFILVVQPSASVIRAACMGWLLGLAPLLGRLPRPSRLLLVAAVVFVAWKPWALIYDAGFALSFLAMGGLLTWSVYFSRRWEKMIPWTFWREVISATLGACLMTAPYLAWAFGQVSVFGVIGSILVVPIIPWVMGLGTLAILFPFISFFVLAAQGFLEAILWVARFTDRLPAGFFPEIRLPIWGMLLLYYALFIIWDHIKLSTQTYPHSHTPHR